MRWDVVVLGAGSAGAAAAHSLARRGLSVLALERKPLDAAGARWCNAVPGWCFDASDVPRPTAPEARGGPPIHLVAGWGPERVRIAGQDVLEVDMRHLVARLQRLATEAGATLRGGVTVRGVVGDVVHTDAGAFRARWIVDASGLHGVERRRAVDRRDLCVASQQVRTLADPEAGRAWFARHGAAPGEILCFTGVAGGYAIVNVRLHGDDEVAILTGSLPGLGHPSGVTLMERFVADHPWIGPVRFGGARAIPVSAPKARLHEGRIAFLGDAAVQVFAAHGSGVGAQLVAARLLAETFAAGGTPADYSRAWWARYGPDLRASARFQLASRHLSTDALGRLMRAGVMAPDMVRGPLEQRPPRITPAALAAIGAGVARDPGALLGLARAGWTAISGR